MSKVNRQTITFEEFAKKQPEFFKKPKENKYDSDRMRFLCQCKNGHMFDYRERELYPPENRHYAPCQGKCPVCGCSEFSAVSTTYYPIQWNFLGY